MSGRPAGPGMLRPLAIAALLVPLFAGCLSTDGGSEAPADALPPLRFLPPVDLQCPSEGLAQLQDAALGGCGQFGEPVLEVAGDGTVWASATCCVGRSPPIWVSRDGAQTFDLLPFADRTGVVRDAFGIEGDFAIDDAGNVYFFDISAATTWFSKYRGDGTHVFTKADAFPPLVDRPWVRAGRADEVWVFYNTGFATNLFYSTDGGLTWTVTPVGFECGLMTIGQGPARDRLFVAGCGNDPKLWVSEDGGRTFGAPIDLPVPDLGFPVERLRNGTRTEVFMPPVADASGAIYVPITYTTDVDGLTQALYVDVVHPDGRVAGPFLVSTRPWNEKPWGAAGAPGHFAVAWYAADRDRSQTEEAVWRLQVAATSAGLAAAPAFATADADPEPVLTGAFGRALGDFLQADVGPDGRFYTIYARRGDDGLLVNRVVVTDGLDLGPGVPANGPHVPR
jgi:hypothetical protein